MNINRGSSTVTLQRSIWAVIIGIDDYPHTPLRCAVADAKAMSEFLTDHLEVPKDHITELLAPHGGDMSSHDYPTRQNILSKLWSLHQDERIQDSDTIIVFYAGHGAVYCYGAVQVEESDRGWRSIYELNRTELAAMNSGPFIDAIVPQDRGLPDSDPAYSGRKVLDICDRELNAIFTITRHKKGPNILFIADCGRTAPNVRRPQFLRDSTGRTSRALPPLMYVTREMLSRAQWNIDEYKDGISGIQNTLDVNWTPDLSSFVTLAACRMEGTAHEPAHEHTTLVNGFYTGALLDTLESDKVDENTTFEGLIAQVADTIGTWQVPEARGDRKNLRLWFRDN